MRTNIGQGDLDAASRAGARAAAVQHEYSAAQQAAVEVAAIEVARAGLACESHETQLETGRQQFEPGGFVTVTVTCNVSWEDLFLPWLSLGPKDLDATSSEPIACIRGGGSRPIGNRCYGSG